MPFVPSELLESLSAEIFKSDVVALVAVSDVIVDDALERKPLRSGLVLNTARPVPVSSVSALMRFALVSPPVSSEATPLAYEKKPWSPFAISAASIDAPNGLPRPRLEVATH